MPRRALDLVATERHVESALAKGHAASTWRSFLRRMAALSTRQPATPESTQLATSMALDELRNDLGWDAGYALVRMLDETLGTLRRAGVDASLLRRTKGKRGELLARLLERTESLLERPGL